MNCLIQHGGDWLRFSDPVDVLTAHTPEEVCDCLKKIECSGLWAAGFISYEAAGAFDEALPVFGGLRSVAAETAATERVPPVPLLQFGLFKNVERTFVSAHSGRHECLPHYQLNEWTPSVSREEYTDAIAKIKEHIAAGETYQVNYTFRLKADFEGDPFAFFCDLTAAQQGGYGAYIETDNVAVCSASPELFFELKDGVITSRPMKGTRPRGLTAQSDRVAAAALQASEKDGAENIMIVDMIRNDIGRIAAAGSVETVSRFEVEKYPTVWQMTSTVKGNIQLRMDANGREWIGEIFKALFPCASITGAPKAKTMEIIQGLEKSTRGVYTGSIGFIDPNGDAQFSVAIRTAVIQDGKAEYGIGGGIVWDSDAESEYEEALSKAAILTKRIPEFRLLETMLWEDGAIFLLERHLKRLTESAEYFDFHIDQNEIRDSLRDLRFDCSTRIRLLLSKNGTFGVKAASCRLQRQDASVTLAMAKHLVDSGDVFLYHKTTNRDIYAKAQSDFPDADDVLLFNERGEVTESCIANVVVELDGKKVTPPVSCGLLAGTFRDELLEASGIEERIITRDDLQRADAVWLINSVRRWQTVRFA